MRSVTGIVDRLLEAELVGSVVGKDARGGRHARADALAAADSELGGGAPTQAGRVVCVQRVLAARAEVRGSGVDVDESGRR